MLMSKNVKIHHVKPKVGGFGPHPKSVSPKTGTSVSHQGTPFFEKFLGLRPLIPLRAPMQAIIMGS